MLPLNKHTGSHLQVSQTKRVLGNCKTHVNVNNKKPKHQIMPNPTNSTPANQTAKTPPMSNPIPDVQNSPGPTPNPDTSTTTQTAKAKTSQKPTFTKLTSIIVAIAILFFGGLAATAYAVTYSELSLGNKNLDLQIARAVQALPFMPKTPQFVLMSAINQHKEVTTFTFDVSIATQSDDIFSSFGMQKIDIEAKGAIDFTDINNPKLETSLNVTKDLNSDIKYLDEMLYIKINQAPGFLLSLAGFSPEMAEPFLNRWIVYDASTINTKARSEIQAQKEEKYSRSEINRGLEALSSDKVIEAVTMTNDNSLGHPAFKLHLEATPEIIDEWIAKASETVEENQDTTSNKSKPKYSDTIKEFTVDIWISKSDYYVRRTTLSMTMVNEDTFGVTLPNGKSELSLVAVFEADNFNNPVEIEIPASATPLEQILLELQQSLITNPELYAQEPEAFMLEGEAESQNGSIFELFNSSTGGTNSSPGEIRLITK
jgi:hypothetical protein